MDEESTWVSELIENKIDSNIGIEAEQAVEQAMEIITYDYPYQLSTTTTNYQSVSEVANYLKSRIMKIGED